MNRFSVTFVRLAFALSLVTSAARAGTPDATAAPITPAPWLNKPSPALAAKLRPWRITFEEGEPQNAPKKGVFAAGGTLSGTERLVRDDGRATTIKLTPVARRIRYIPPTDGHTDPLDTDVTPEMLDVLRSPPVSRFVTAHGLNPAGLDVAKDFAVALVQEFDTARHMPRKKEHVWSISWRIERQTDTSYDGIPGPGLHSPASTANFSRSISRGRSDAAWANGYALLLRAGDR